MLAVAVPLALTRPLTRPLEVPARRCLARKPCGIGPLRLLLHTYSTPAAQPATLALSTTLPSPTCLPCSWRVLCPLMSGV